MAERALKKQRTEYIAITVLLLAALFIGIAKVKKKDVDDEVFSRKEFNKKWKEVEMLEREVPRLPEGISYAVYTKRPPFKNPFEGEVKIEGEVKKDEYADIDVSLPIMTFQGMVWNSVRPQIIIDNKVYNIGDTVDAGPKVKKITRDGIYLRYKGREFIVRPK